MDIITYEYDTRKVRSISPYTRTHPSATSDPPLFLYRHSAAVTEDGFLFTWGEGDFGRLGHGDSQSRVVPTRVEVLLKAGVLNLFFAVYRPLSDPPKAPHDPLYERASRSVIG